MHTRVRHETTAQLFCFFVVAVFFSSVCMLSSALILLFIAYDKQKMKWTNNNNNNKWKLTSFCCAYNYVNGRKISGECFLCWLVCRYFTFALESNNDSISMLDYRNWFFVVVLLWLARTINFMCRQKPIFFGLIRFGIIHTSCFFPHNINHIIDISFPSLHKIVPNLAKFCRTRSYIKFS